MMKSFILFEHVKCGWVVISQFTSNLCISGDGKPCTTVAEGFTLTLTRLNHKA
jgi:hypothetical protein